MCGQHSALELLFDGLPHDASHEKTDPKVFVVVIPKVGWRPSFFWYDTDFLEFEAFDFTDHIL